MAHLTKRVEYHLVVGTSMPYVVQRGGQITVVCSAPLAEMKVFCAPRVVWVLVSVVVLDPIPLIHRTDRSLMIQILYFPFGDV